MTDIHRRTCGYDIPSERVDGMDAIAVHKAVSHAAEWVREHSRPYLLEAMTYRFRGHSMADPARYRSTAEVELWKSRDPLINMGKRLIDEGIADQSALDEMRADAVSKVNEAVRFAEESEWPEDREVYSDIYC